MKNGVNDHDEILSTLGKAWSHLGAGQKLTLRSRLEEAHIAVSSQNIHPNFVNLNDLLRSLKMEKADEKA